MQPKETRIEDDYTFLKEDVLREIIDYVDSVIASQGHIVATLKCVALKI